MGVSTVARSTAMIGILRGVTTVEAPWVGRCLYDAGFRSLEVPLNSPNPFLTIRTLRAAVPTDCVVGAGTVLTVDQVRQCSDAGAQIIVSPNTYVPVIAETLRLGMGSFPGAATPSEAFSAIRAGADSIKVFPAEQVRPAGLKAWTAVMPRGIGLIPVGGVNASNIGTWLTAGATGLGFGSALFTPRIALDELRWRAATLLAALDLAIESEGNPAPSH